MGEMNGFGQDVRGKDAEGKTALHRVADSDEDQPDLIEALVEKGADVNATNRRGQTPLYNAVQYNNTASVGRLLDHGADVNARVGEEHGGGSALLVAASNGYDECAKLLLEHGADVGATDRRGQTPLHLAAMNNHTAIVRLLLDHGADVGARDANGQTALGSSEDSGRTRADGGSGAELAASFSESLEEEDEEALEREAANKKLQHDQIQQLLRNG